MFKHILKMVWNRKKLNALIILEIFISFLVLFAVSSVYVHYARLHANPLGFDYADTWELVIDRGGPWKPEYSPRMKSLREVLLALEPVEAVEALDQTPFRGSTWISTVHHGDKEVSSIMNTASDGIANMLGIRLVEGRWFGPEDEGLDWEPVVINRRLREALFGDENPMGQDISGTEPNETGGRRVVGIIDDFRQHGEFHPLQSYTFVRHRMEADPDRPIHGLQLKLRPGTTAAFEEELFRTAQAAAPDWSFVVADWSELREQRAKSYLIPMAVLAVVSMFLLVMVGLGLMGVLWQNVTRRTQEIGLRRAMGAAARRIHLQITGELLMVTTLGVLGGVLVAVQLPILGTFSALTWSTSLYSIAVAVLAIYAISVLCALYPSWFATRIQPAEALHYE